MRRHMRGKVIKYSIDPPGEVNLAKPPGTPPPRRQIGQKGTTEPVIGEDAMDIGADDQAVSRHGAVGTAADIQSGRARSAPSVRPL